MRCVELATEKRFTYEYDGYNGNLFDNEFNTFYQIEDSDENIEVLCDRLNELVEENEQLKQREKTLEGMIRTFDEGCKEIYDDKCRLEKENEQLRKQNEELINGMQETARLSAKAITKPMVEERWGKGVDYD